MWNPFGKKNSGNQNDPNNAGFLQRLAMKKIMQMSPEERMKMMSQLLTPENIAKNRGAILQSLEQMERSGQLSADQVKLAKQKFGI